MPRPIRLGDSRGMHVLVLISGVADPKWPLPSQPDASALEAHASRYAVLSPFDEAALELALQLRDAEPATTIAALVSGPETLARKVAEWKLDRVQRLMLADAAATDARNCAQALAAAIRPLAQDASLVLTGREFGDWDDGSVSALLARTLQLPHVALTLGLDMADGQPRVTRQRGAVLERMRLARPALLSVTNDARNRLRHPLLKNVMAARKIQIETLAVPASAGTLRCTGLAPAAPPTRAASCRMLTGSLEEQARALAEVLREEVVTA